MHEEHILIKIYWNGLIRTNIIYFIKSLYLLQNDLHRNLFEKKKKVDLNLDA